MSAFAPFEAKMLAEGLPSIVIEGFRRNWERLSRGETGMLSEADIEGVDGLRSSDALADFVVAGARALQRVVVVKLNGGLGTSMGMTRSKSLLPAKNGLTFLDITARQIMRLRETHGARVPLVLMNSFRTHEDSLAALEPYDDLSAGLPPDFLQNKVPKVRADDLSPASWPRDREHEWCPPGHGDLYVALRSSGILDALLERNIDLAFVSNSDNLGARVDLGILGWMAEEGIPFVMEAANRTEADKKGGHLARRRSDKRLVLREVAQCPPAEIGQFQNVGLFRYFNTNTLWLNLHALDVALRGSKGVLDLPMIRNEKTLDPTDRSTPKVVQLETAMGAAISTFEGAEAIVVPRERFIPVKTTGDLLALWSDLVELGADFRLTPAEGRLPGDLAIELDASHFARIDQLEARFPRGAPSLRECTKLVVKGDVRFGAGVRLRGDVRIEHAGSGTLTIPDGEVIG